MTNRSRRKNASSIAFLKFEVRIASPR